MLCIDFLISTVLDIGFTTLLSPWCVEKSLAVIIENRINF